MTLGFYPYLVYENKVQLKMQQGMSRKEAKILVDEEEKKEWWEYQRRREDENQAWFDDYDNDDSR